MRFYAYSYLFVPIPIVQKYHFPPSRRPKNPLPGTPIRCLLLGGAGILDPEFREVTGLGIPDIPTPTLAYLLGCLPTLLTGKSAFAPTPLMVSKA